MSAKTYDTKCLELAKAFLSDEPEIDTPENAAVLAGDIQDAIETFIRWARDNKAAA